jgi:hypothetical protein
MEFQNAFVEHPGLPTSAEIDTALGSSAPMWHELVDWIHAHGAPEEEWKCTSPKRGWSLRLKRKQRNIVYLVPCRGCMQVAVVLGERAVQAAWETHLPKPALDALEAAPRYPEGTGVRMIVSKPSDLISVEKLIEIKMAH